MKNPKIDKNPEKLSFVTKFFYGGGDIGFALTDTIIGLLFANFLIKGGWLIALTDRYCYPGRANLGLDQ